jgi:hypothetical protein
VANGATVSGKLKKNEKKKKLSVTLKDAAK